MLAGFTHEPVVELSERLARADAAARSATLLRQRRRIGHRDRAEDELSLLAQSRAAAKNAASSSLAGSYHGETLGALAVTDVALFRDTYAPLLRRSARCRRPDWRLARTRRDAARLRRAPRAALEAHLAAAPRDDRGADRRAAGAGRGRHGDVRRRIPARARARSATRYGVHLIADEIMTGFGRTGTLFALRAGRHRAGLPVPVEGHHRRLSAAVRGADAPTTSTQAFYDDDVARGFLHSHSYTGNALACRAALAMLDIFERDDVIAANRAQARASGARRRSRSPQHPRVRNFRSTGMIWAFDVDTRRSATFARWFYRPALERGTPAAADRQHGLLHAALRDRRTSEMNLLAARARSR